MNIVVTFLNSKGDTLKVFTAMFMLLLSISLLSGEHPPKFKGNGSFGLINGATLGMSVKTSDKPNREHYVNAVFYTRDSLWFAGLNFEHRFYHSKHFYTLLTTGLDYIEMVNAFGDPGGGNSDNADRYGSLLLPHVTVGLGYQTPLTNDVNVFIEWDVGIKASISNINIGLTF